MVETQPAGLEIRHCGRTIAGDLVGIDIQWRGELASDGSVLWSMHVTSEDGADEIRLAYGVSGGTAQQFVDDLSTGRRQPVEPDADLDDGEIVIRFPASVVGVAVEWPVWRAVITVDDQDVATRVVPTS
jgi:hypothetical protein